MKKILLSLAGAALLLFACSNDDKTKFHVEGCIENAEDSMLYFEAATIDGVKKLDSVKLSSDGKYAFAAPKVDGCPEFFRLRMKSGAVVFSIDSTETVTINSKLPGFADNSTVEGSEDATNIRAIAALQKEVQARLVAVEKNEDMLPGDMVDSITAIIDSYKLRITTEYIIPRPASATAYYAVCQSLADLRGSFQLFNPIDDRSDVRLYAAVATAWDGAWPESERTIQLCNMAIKGVQDTAPQKQQVIEIDEDKVHETGILEIELPDIHSNIKTLSSLKGKVVLLDFTIYGAKESAERTRLMRSLYEKYRDQGFTIYQVSLDPDLHYWKTACDHLPWTCVHDVEGRAAALYHIENLPTFFLVNRNNEIILRSDFMEGSLEDNLKKLL